MIWATVSSWSCFCWLYRASPSLAAKNIINLVSVLTIWWCPRVEYCVVGRGCLLWPVHFLGKILLAFSLLHSVLQGQICLLLQVSSWLPTFAFQSPLMKRTSFLCVISRRSCRFSQNGSTSASSALLVRAYTWITVILNDLPWKWTEIILSFLRLHQSTAFQILLLTMRAAPFLLRDSCPQ